MGVSIHYRGSINDKKQVHQFIDEVQDICESMSWESSILDEDWNRPSKVIVEPDEEGAVSLSGHAGLKGVLFRPHPESEGMGLLFDKDGDMNSLLNLAFQGSKEEGEKPWVSVKTQFAGPEVHIGICKLLEYLQKKYISNLEVNDEGNYWESGDVEEVENRMGIIKTAMDALEEGLQELELDPNLTEERLIKKIEDLIEKLNEEEGLNMKIMTVKVDKPNEEKEEDDFSDN